MSRADELLASMAGKQVPGGCHDCDAYQTVERQLGFWLMRVHHDDSCPWLAQREGGQHE